MEQYKIPFKIIVLKNTVLGMVREYQHFTYKESYSVIDLSGSPDLEKLSAAYNIPFIRVFNMDDADEKIDAFLSSDGPVLLECLVDPMDIVR